MRERGVIQNENQTRIPQFADYQEEADFWYKHDFVDFMDQWKPVQVKVAKNLSSGLTVRFDESTLGKFLGEANKQGVGPTTLIRMWILEKLRNRGGLSASLNNAG